MYTNPHLALLQMHYEQKQIRAAAERDRMIPSRRRHRNGLYVRRKKLMLPAKNSGARAGSIPARL